MFFILFGGQSNYFRNGLSTVTTQLPGPTADPLAQPTPPSAMLSPATGVKIALVLLWSVGTVASTRRAGSPFGGALIIASASLASSRVAARLTTAEIDRFHLLPASLLRPRHLANKLHTHKSKSKIERLDSNMSKFKHVLLRSKSVRDGRVKTLNSVIDSGVQLSYWWCYQSDRPMDQNNPQRFDLTRQRNPELLKCIVKANQRLKAKLKIAPPKKR